MTEQRRSLRDFASLLFALGLAFMLITIGAQYDFGAAPMLIGKGILDSAVEDTGAVLLKVAS